MADDESKEPASGNNARPASADVAGVDNGTEGAEGYGVWLSPEEAAPLAGAVREFPGYVALAEDREIGPITRAIEREAGVLVVATDAGYRIIPASAVAWVDHGARTVGLRIRRDRVDELPRWDDSAGDEQVSPEVVYAAALVLLQD